ncbi:MAG: glycosyltransferase family 4 protein [Pseudomonadota bacterium]
MRKKRIILLTRTYLPIIGGREIVVYYLAKAYHQLGYDVRVVGQLRFARRRNRPTDARVHSWPSLVSHFPAWIVSERVKETLQFLELRIILLVEIFLFGADIVHSHATYPQGYVVALLKSFLKNKVVALTPHGNDIHTIPEIGHGMGLNPEIAKKIKIALEKTDVITSIAEAVSTSIKRYGIDEEKITYIPNGVDVERFAFNNEKQIDNDEDSIVNIVSVGNFHVRKGHRVLIDAVDKLNQENNRYRLTIVGRKSRELVEYATSKSIACTFTGKIEFTPRDSKNPDELAEIFSKSTVYVSSSINDEAEGMSLAVLEAMAAGLPVVASNISGNRDIVEGFKNGILVNPNDVSALSNGIKEILQSPERFYEMSQNSVKGANSVSWLEVAKKYLTEFEAAANKS